MNTKTDVKIAIVHDYIKEYGGAERVLEELAKIFPEADIYTSLYIPKFLGPHAKRFKHFKIHTSFLQRFPFKEKLISPFRLIAPLAFMSMNLSSYDAVIVSQTGAYFPNLINKGHAKLICYTHTPPRYLYGYMTARDWKSNKLKLVIGSIMNHFLRIFDFNSSKNVDQFIANSKEVALRIKKFYRKDAVVIYPPVEIADDTKQIIKSQGKQPDKEYYLTGGRLARAKGTDIIVNAFLKNKKPIKIFGKGFAGFEERLLSKAKGDGGKVNIEFLGEITDEEKLRLMENARAFIFASFDEDFGITPVEAMGQGTPVIAYNSGGVQETVIDQKTGLLYAVNTPDCLNSAIDRFEKLNISKGACVTQAKKFSPSTFDSKLKTLVLKTIYS
ncbi:MAG: glycosyltransferase [Candidatus Levybacteria bacterium]|nr:glycosyltransferase [Candidatus Levybacteria bacterium]MBP9814703.1 glycosyltransferase [Candidatus Levybacteria bacterium]